MINFDFISSKIKNNKSQKNKIAIVLWPDGKENQWYSKILFSGLALSIKNFTKVELQTVQIIVQIKIHIFRYNFFLKRKIIVKKDIIKIQKVSQTKAIKVKNFIQKSETNHCEKLFIKISIGKAKFFIFKVSAKNSAKIANK